MKREISAIDGFDFTECNMLEIPVRSSYTAYGLKIESTIALPDLPLSEGKTDLKIRRGNLSRDFLAKNFVRAEIYERRGCRIQTSAQAMLLEYEAVGKFFVRGGSEIVVEPDAAATDADLQPFLTGPVFSVALHQRGNLVLHASAVVIGGAAAIFLGAKGDGKSTLAAYLQSVGFPLISDDIVPVNFQNGKPRTFSGYPKIKLFADSVEAVGASAKSLPLIHRRAEKFSFDGTKNFLRGCVPLGAIFVLSAGEKMKIKPLDLKSAFIELIRHSHLNRFLKALNQQGKHFEQCQNLVRSAPVFQLERPHRFDKLPEIKRLLENHALELGRQRASLI